MSVSGEVPPPGGASGIQNIVHGGSQTISGQQSTGAGSRMVQHVGAPAAGDGETVTLADLSAAILALRTELGSLLERTPDALSGAAAVAVDRDLAAAQAETETVNVEPEPDVITRAIDRAAAVLGSVTGLGAALAALQEILRKLFVG
jgi:hypothetical protein